MPLNNFGIVEPGLLYRSAQPDFHGYQDAHERLGVMTVFMLNGECVDSVLEFGEWAGSKAFSWPVFRPDTRLRYEMHSLEPYCPNDEIIQDLVEQISEAKEKAPVLVHCAHGRDRTGSVMGAYRILKHGWTAEEAWEEQQIYGDYGRILTNARVLKEFLDGLEFLQKAKAAPG